MIPTSTSLAGSKWISSKWSKSADRLPRAVAANFRRVQPGRISHTQRDESSLGELFASRLDILDDPERGWKKVALVRDGAEDMNLLRTMEILKKLAWVTLIKDFRVLRLQKRSEIIVERLWESFIDQDRGCGSFHPIDR